MRQRTQNEPRAVVTGLGAVTPLGRSLPETWRSFRTGLSGLAPLKRFQSQSYEGLLWGEVEEFDARPYFRVPKALKLADRKTVLAVAAASEALADAGLTGCEPDRDGLAVLLGVGSSDLLVEGLGYALRLDPELRAAEDVPFFAERILSELNPLWLLVTLPNMVSAHVAIQVGACGPNNTIMTDWAAGAQAIGEGLRLIQSREAEVVLAGGADAGVAPLAAEAYVQAGLLPRRPNGAHSGFALAEGSTIVVLEERRRALARGARIYGELTGYCAAYGNAHLGLSSAMRGALQESEWEARTVTLVNLCAHHELSGPEGERQLLERLLPGRFESLDSRPAMGHTLAASGALDLVLLLLRLGEREPGSRALCNAMGFRGQAVTLAVERAA